MAWIKRNLFFAISGLVALILIGAGGWYLFSKMGLNKATQAQLEEAYSTLDGLIQKKVGDPKVAEQQIQQLREISQKFRAQFKSVPPIPYTTNVALITSAQFATTLQVTLDQLQRAAAVASVDVPQQYGFSFQAERSLTKFAPGSLGPLSIQLGEVKAICDVLYGARVNALLSIRRERVSSDDDAGGLDSYLEKKSTMTEAAVITTYEISFRCFGTELSTVLTAFATSDYCFVVESVNVGVAKDTGSSTTDTAPRPTGTAMAVTGRGGLPTFLDEEQITVTLGLQLVKMNGNAGSKR